LLGGVSFADIKCTLKDAAVDAAGKAVPAVTLNIGNFIQVFIQFLIIAAAVFMVVKAVNTMRKPAPGAPPPGPTKDQELLMQIRDALKK
jgi:large conductance mechanosensitive channel